MYPHCNHGADLLPVQNFVKVTKYQIKVTDVFSETTKKQTRSEYV